MIKYELNQDLTSKMKNRQLIVDSYSVDPKTNHVTIIIKDEITNKYLKLVFKNAEIVNESFDIVGHPIIDVAIGEYVKYFKASYFTGLMLIVQNKYNEDQQFAILSNIGGV